MQEMTKQLPHCCRGYHLSFLLLLWGIMCILKDIGVCSTASNVNETTENLHSWRLLVLSCV